MSRARGPCSFIEADGTADRIQRFQIKAARHATTARRSQFHQWCSKRHIHCRTQDTNATPDSNIDNRQSRKIKCWENGQYMYECHALHASLFCCGRYNYVTYCSAIYELIVQYTQIYKNVQNYSKIRIDTWKLAVLFTFWFSYFLLWPHKYWWRYTSANLNVFLHW